MKEKGFLKQPGNNNPVMTGHFGADPYAMEYDGRVYFYMTADKYEYDAELTKYKDKKIESQTIQKLNEMIADCNEKGNLHIQLVEDAGKTFNKLLNKAMDRGSEDIGPAPAGVN